MADAKDRAWHAQETRQVTAGPRPWWQRLMGLFARRVWLRPQRTTQPYATLACPLTPRPVSFWQGKPSDWLVREATEVVVALGREQVGQVICGGAGLFTTQAGDVLQDIADTIICTIDHLPLMAEPYAADAAWHSVCRREVMRQFNDLSLPQIRWISRLCIHSPYRIVLSLVIRYPATWEHPQAQLSQVTPLLAGMAVGVGSLPAACLQDLDFVDSAPTDGEGWWSFTIREDDPPMEGWLAA